MELKAAIFDLDGTLIDSLHDLYLIMNMVLADKGYPELSKSMVRHYIGNGAREFVRLSIPEKERSESNIDLCMAKYIELYDIYGQKNTKPFKGILSMIKSLKKHGIKIGVLSNKPHEATVDVTNSIFSSFSFEAVIGQKNNFPPKPDPESSIYTAGLMGVKPCETAFIGDGETDVLVGLRGGFYQASVLWGYRSREELERVGAVNFFTSPKELLNIFNIKEK